LLFEAEKNNVWDAAAKDEAALEKKFRDNRKKYRWNAPHFKGYILSANDADALRAAQKALSHGVPAGMEAMDFLRSGVNKDSVRVKVAGPYTVEQGENSTIDHFAFKDKKATARSVDAGMKYTTVVGRIEKRPTSYVDVRSQVLEDVQKEREQAWLLKLRQQYPVQLYTKVFETINHPQ
jgi:peptidyl-prolyl cis-trans isomerase